MKCFRASSFSSPNEQNHLSLSFSHTHTYRVLSSSLFPRLYLSYTRSVRLALVFTFPQLNPTFPSLALSLLPFLRVSLSHRLFKLRLVNIQAADLCSACFLVIMPRTQIKARLNSIKLNLIAASLEQERLSAGWRMWSGPAARAESSPRQPEALTFTKSMKLLVTFKDVAFSGLRHFTVV